MLELLRMHYTIYLCIIAVVSEGMQDISWTTAKEYIIKYASTYMSLQRLTKVDANLKPSVINHKNISGETAYVQIYWYTAHEYRVHIYKLDACVCACMSM